MKKLEREICKELEAIDKEIDISQLQISEKEDLGESDPLKECLICFEEVTFLKDSGQNLKKRYILCKNWKLTVIFF